MAVFLFYWFHHVFLLVYIFEEWMSKVCFSGFKGFFLSSAS